MTPGPSSPDPGPRPAEPHRAAGGKRWLLPGIVLVAVGLAGVWAFSRQRSAAVALERTESALQLQVLAGRLGMAAFEAEYGDYDAARRFASQAFDGIANYGIEEGALRQDYAEVLDSRDDVIAMLATRRAEAAERLMELFYSLQVPVDTELDPARILPAADSGLGLEPPRRFAPPPGAPAPAGVPDSASTLRDSLRGPADGGAPDDEDARIGHPESVADNDGLRALNG